MNASKFTERMKGLREEELERRINFLDERVKKLEYAAIRWEVTP